jgi:hypothetical protein
MMQGNCRNTCLQRITKELETMGILRLYENVSKNPVLTSGCVQTPAPATALIALGATDKKHKEHEPNGSRL